MTDDRCMACSVAFRAGDRYLFDVSGGCIHADCCGPERDSYAHLDGEPLGPAEPIPTPMIWKAQPEDMGSPQINGADNG